MSRTSRGLVGSFLLLGLASWAQAAQWKLSVRNPGEALGETPIVAPVKGDIASGDYAIAGENGNGSNGRAQVFADDGKTWLVLVVKSLPARSETRLTLVPDVKSELSKPGVEFRPAGTDLEVVAGGKPLTTYRPEGPAKPYFYPVFGPNGSEYTRAWPMKKDVPGEDRDHNHQRSLWFTHGNVNGVDFWATDPLNGDKPTYGTIKETSRKTLSGAAFGQIRSTDDWLDRSGKVVLTDERLVRFYNTEGVRVIDFDIVLHASKGPVTFGDTKEGMFGVRVASSMDVTKKKGGKITNAEGIHDEAAWGKASPWVDYTGPVDGKTVGVAILNHPSSFRHPTTWHVRTYGLFAANPFGWHDFGQKTSGEHTVPAGGSIRFGYRVVLHEGTTESARIAQGYQGYAQPPVVELTAE